jgi:peptidoglycan/xylan/chitin deacetylase (PgdA/CDA1 family)
MIAKNSLATMGRIKEGAHSLIALAFLFVPLVMTGLFLFNLGANTTAAWAETIPNNKIATCEVTSQEGVLFEEAIVSVTFDDGWKSVADNAAPILCEYRIPTTQYVITGNLTSSAYMSAAQLDAFNLAGHEIASHSVSHMDFGKANAIDAAREFESSKNTLVKMGLAEEGAVNFAYPYGSTSEMSDNIGKQYYTSMRDTLTGKFSPSIVNTRDGYDPYKIIGYTVENDTDIADIRKALQYAKQHKGWFILSLHQIDDTDTDYSISSEMFRSILKTIMDENVKTMTVRDALATYEDEA